MENDETILNSRSRLGRCRHSTTTSQHVSESEARQMRKLAAALRQPPQHDAVDVNTGSDAALMQSLARIRKLPSAVAQRIVRLRPFASRTDLVTRVNAGIMKKQTRLGPAFIPLLRVEGTRSRATHTRALSYRHIPAQVTLTTPQTFARSAEARCLSRARRRRRHLANSRAGASIVPCSRIHARTAGIHAHAAARAATRRIRRPDCV